ncbi:Uncharacterized protein APZ42_007640 [Daphnia magna]|uniref:CCHC-type domain-containing protein n=1 Tax=Daphnia magna TaxID=35525 RepID=A0A164F6C0_9CRUS|nr:Uncharacterized protein APZ42_007640 [Daphnia magna]
MGNPAEEGGQPTDESAVEPPAIEEPVLVDIPVSMELPVPLELPAHVEVPCPVAQPASVAQPDIVAQPALVVQPAPVAHPVRVTQPAPVVQPAPVAQGAVAKQALGLIYEGFRLLGPLLGHLGNQGPSQQDVQPKQKVKRRRSDLNKMKTRKCNKCQQKGHYQRDCPI